ncbi:MAG: hypothetical protein CVU57_06550 [Deltaproteobacteria bacterium HGW-Deltaproteobacteria-15]|nr:MAG: hypothetical protein CVU57_06550 [Deltaproteobacteria bacterium HGW-Deltaproteobacteria-15]
MAQKDHMIDGNRPTLCMPDGQKSCFACCPPIRPAAYEHLTHTNIVKRILRENTADFDSRGEEVRPITGYSCWALGYLDSEYKVIGCLLHPARHGGLDHRFRVDYGGKCGREICPEAKTFSLLSSPASRFWIRLADGLDSFAYSSRKENPLFHLLGWGGPLLSRIAEEERDKIPTRESFLSGYVFFGTALLPKGNAYLLRKVVVPGGIRLLKEEKFKCSFERFSMELSEEFGRKTPPASDSTASHLLDLEQDFKDFLRLHLGFTRIHLHEALLLKEKVDLRIERFRRTST